MTQQALLAEMAEALKKLSAYENRFAREGTCGQGYLRSIIQGMKECAKQALTRYEQEAGKGGDGRLSLLINALNKIADIPDEADEWDGTEKFHIARNIALDACFAPPTPSEAEV